MDFEEIQRQDSLKPHMKGSGPHEGIGPLLKSLNVAVRVGLFHAASASDEDESPAPNHLVSLVRRSMVLRTSHVKGTQTTLRHFVIFFANSRVW